jgi:hypothetical protein
MHLSELLSCFENEFELDIPEDAEETMVCVRDVRDYVREVYREQGIEVPSGAVFERIRRLVAVLTATDATDIRPDTKLVDLASAG